MLDMEPGIERILRVLPDQSAEKIRPHARVQILADLQCDLDFFRERRRNVLRDLILRGVEPRERGKVGGCGIRPGLELDACGQQPFAENGFGKPGRRRHCDDGGLRRSTYGEASLKRYRDGAVSVRHEIWRVER